MIKNYDEALQYIHSRPRMKKDNTQDRIKLLLKKLGNPERNLKTIHVVGTNGKGSTVAYLARLLQGVGLKVGTFTSPFIVEFNERIEINGKFIANSSLVKLVQLLEPIISEIEQINPELGPSEFELITTLMYLYFAEEKVDIAIVEAGIGGKSDSTNVADNSLMTIITTIGMDHMKLLGDTIDLIAADKAGMIREKGPTIVGNVPQNAFRVIQRQAQNVASKLFSFGIDYNFKQLNNNEFSFRNSNISINEIKTSMIGNFEMEDASYAIEAFVIYAEKYLNKSRFEIINNIKTQIKLTSWPGRMELIATNPPILIDGAHNVPAIKQLISSLKKLNYKKINMVMAVFADKQYVEMINLIKRQPQINLTLTSFNQNGSRKGADFSDFRDNKTNFVSDWHQAIANIYASMQGEKNSVLVVTGSLLFISQVRENLLNN